MLTLVKCLRILARLDRLRILGLCAHADLTVYELAEILELRRELVVRHVRLLVRADLLCHTEQRPRYSYHLRTEGRNGGLVQLLVDLLPHEEGHHQRDLQRLEAFQAARSKATACSIVK
ncbi:transcriptional regulator [Mesorhizobium ciceri]|uniref:transcriptional regulator n=1 Tax=Mesorhizobium TaxID=68287 RepID=UPI0009DFA74A|nr:transcriptional regulator [Mesorhizobium ciceri]